MLKTQLDKFLDENNVITPKHHGSRKLHSTLTAKIAIDDNITKSRESKLATGLMTTDLSAAFDTVDTDILLNKLEHLGVRGPEMQLLYTYL